MPLGPDAGMEYEEKETVLAPGDSLLLHSDGIVEAHNPPARCSASRGSRTPSRATRVAAS